jgi:FixJ family two-component response regulator
MSTKSYVIAVIDDHHSVLISVARLLSSLGYDTELYVSAEEFLEAAKITKAFCLIVDVELPEKSGIELALHLANAGFTIPIILMTAKTDDSLKMRAMQIGCAAFLPKPFSPNMLIQALSKLPCSLP